MSSTETIKTKRVGRYEVRLVRNGSEHYRYEKLTSSDAAKRIIIQLVRNILEDSPVERFLVVSVDTKLRPIGVHTITQGTLDASLVHPREVFQAAILANAAHIFLVHNHPSGDIHPSPEDRLVTDRLRQAGNLLGIEVMDHIIVGVDPETEEFKAVSLGELPPWQ
jgi:DNA repair protein RadC